MTRPIEQSQQWTRIHDARILEQSIGPGIKRCRWKGFDYAAKAFSSASSLQCHTTMLHVLMRLPRHTGLCRQHGWVKQDGIVYRIMDFAPCGDLATLLQIQGQVSEGHTRYYIASLANAVHVLHQHDIVHADIHLKNIVLASDGSIRIIDFEQAVVASMQKHPIFMSSKLRGTPPFAPPEAIEGTVLSPATDWWAIGVVLYALACGSLPFQHGDSNVMEQFRAVRRTLDRPSSLSPVLIHLLEGLLNKDAAQRFGYTDVQEHPWFRGVDWSNPGPPPPLDHKYRYDTVEECMLPSEQQALFDGF